MPIENRELTAGTRLVARYKKEEYWATVVEGEKGGLRYRLEDGREFKSLSSAGSAVTGGVACNGWRFWSVAEEGKAPAPKAARKAAKDANKKGLFERLPDQEGQPEGMARYFCDACMEAFEAPAGEEPATCPKGHQPDGSPVESAV
jgi:hypothetical protein